MNYLPLLLLLVTSHPIFPQDIDSLCSGELTVIIKGFASDEGNCRFAIDNNKEIFENIDSVWIGKIIPIQNKEATVVIDSLKYGEYAIKIYQDKNNNKILDTNLLGMPTEDYGFSNNASGWFGPPSWDDAKFIFNKPEMIITINLD